MAQRLMFFVDFDGTISRQDVSCLMLDLYAGGSWREHNLRWEKSEISTEECARLVLADLKAGFNELERFFAQVEIDETFTYFVSWAHEHQFPVTILSDGYDNYISKVLDRYHLDIPFYANHLEYKQGWVMECCHRSDECSQCGVCKTELLQRLLLPGHTSVYIGDGYSDICPAQHADMVFAKGQLLRWCAARHLPCHPFQDFRDVIMTLEDQVP